MSVSRKINRSKSKSRMRRRIGGSVDVSTSMTPTNSPTSQKKTKTKKIKSPKRRGKPSMLTKLLGEYKEPRYGKKGTACSVLNEKDCEKHYACDYITKSNQCRKKRSA